jgi:hypothetical protein
MAIFVIKPATIPAGESLSGIVDCSETGTGAGVLVAIIMPEAWNSSGGITFQISPDNIDFHELHRMTGEEVTIAATTGGIVLVDADVARSVRFLRLRAGSKQQPVAQDEERLFQVVLAGEAAPVGTAAGAKPARHRAAHRKTPRKTAHPRRKQSPRKRG